MQPIQDYYDQLAKDYDQDRFSNSYGRYIDRLERKIVSAWLAQTPPSEVLDIACGTGRFLEFAMTGVDISPAMIDVAAKKFPDRRLIRAALPDLPSLKGCYQAALCLHAFMHFDEKFIEQSLQSIARHVRVGGQLIVDIPSRHRRAWGRRRPSESGWHGNTAATATDIERWAGSAWRIVQYRGILFFPIHRLPAVLRPLFRHLDEWIGRTPLARYSSYHLYRLERRA